jgi:hypothetical protein
MSHLAGPDGCIVFSGDLGRPHDAIMRAPELQRIERELGWACEVPDYLEIIDLPANSRGAAAGNAV